MFAHLPPREACIATHIDRLPDGAAIDIKTLSKEIPEYGQQAMASALKAISAVGHLRRVRERPGGDRTQWVQRTYFSRTPRSDAWWRQFLSGSDSPAEAAPEPPRPVHPPGRTPAYSALAALGRTDPRMTLSANECIALEPLAAEWLARGVTAPHLVQALTNGLPGRRPRPRHLRTMFQQPNSRILDRKFVNRAAGTARSVSYPQGFTGGVQIGCAGHMKVKEKHRPLHRLAASQGGILLTSQAVACGLLRSGAADILRRAGWVQLLFGVWAQPGRNVDLRLRLLAVQLKQPHWIASHSAAAALHRIDMVRPNSIELTVPRRGPRTRVRGVTLHPAPLADDEVTVVAGVRATTVLRTTCDLMCTLPLHEAVIAADDVLARRLLRREHIADALAPPHPRRVGVRAARRALALTDHASGSPAETKARLEMHEVGLFPESQAEVITPNGRVRRLDFLFRAEGLGIEIEGHAWHGSRSAHQNDAIRFNELAGCPEIREMLRFTYDDVFRRPQRFIRTIQEALQRLRRQGPLPRRE